MARSKRDGALEWGVRSPQRDIYDERAALASRPPPARKRRRLWRLRLSLTAGVPSGGQGVRTEVYRLKKKLIDVGHLWPSPYPTNTTTRVATPYFAAGRLQAEWTNFWHSVTPCCHAIKLRY